MCPFNSTVKNILIIKEMSNRQTFNFACNEVAFRFKNSVWELLTVYYYDDRTKQYQLRLPGGTVQFRDITDAIISIMAGIHSEPLLNEIQKIVDRIPEYKISHEEKILEIKQIYDNEMGALAKKHGKIIPEPETRKIKTKKFFAENMSFNDQLHRIYLSLKIVLTYELMWKIATEVRRITLARELQEETFGVTKSIPVLATESFVGCHHKLSYTSVDEVNAPDSMRGSPDKDIESSQWLPIDKAIKEMFTSSQSSHLMLVKSAITKVLSSFKNHPHIAELRQYLDSND